MKTIVLRLSGAAAVAALALASMSLNWEIRFVIFLVIGIPAFALMILSRRQLGDAFSVQPRAKMLVTTGLYARIQHPMYVFLDLLLAAVLVIIDMPILLLVWAAFVLIQTIQSRREEQLLSASFGASYHTYADSTWF